MASAKPIEEQIEEIISPSIIAMGFGVVRVRFSGGGHSILQVMAERLDGKGITLDDCAAISRTASAVLDVADPIPGEYTLEVSSPGLDRPLVKLKDFKRFTGNHVKIMVAVPVEGRKKFKGKLEEVKENIIYLSAEENNEEKTIAIPFANIASAKLMIVET